MLFACQSGYEAEKGDYLYKTYLPFWSVGLDICMVCIKSLSRMSSLDLQQHVVLAESSLPYFGTRYVSRFTYQEFM